MTKRWFSTMLVALLSLNACGSNQVVQNAEPDLIAVLKTRPSLTKFTESLESTGVAATLQESGSYTIFAPMDAVVDQGTLDEITVRHHILPERVAFSDLAGENTSYTTLHTDEIEVDATETIKIGDGLMVESDITAKNGVIHVIDKVLTPEDLPTSLSPAVTSSNPADPGAANTGPAELTPPTNLSDPTSSATDGTAIVPAAPTVSQ